MSERNSRIWWFRSAVGWIRGTFCSTLRTIFELPGDRRRGKRMRLSTSVSVSLSPIDFQKVPPHMTSSTLSIRGTRPWRCSPLANKNPSFPIELVTTAHGVPAAEICILSRCSKVNTRNQPLAGHRVFAWSTAMSLTYFPSMATDLFINLYFNYIRFYWIHERVIFIELTTHAVKKRLAQHSWAMPSVAMSTSFFWQSQIYRPTPI